MAEQELNHHSAVILPYCFDETDGLQLVMERKNPGYMEKPGFSGFSNAFNFLGGNWKKGINSERAPEKTAMREMREEFWRVEEADESLSSILGQNIASSDKLEHLDYSEGVKNRLRAIGNLFQAGIVHAADYVMNVRPPAVNSDLTHGSSIFLKKLTRDQIAHVGKLITEFDGKLITDSLKYGSKVAITTLNGINEDDANFSWGYDHVVNDLLDLGALPDQGHRVNNTSNLTSLERIKYSPEARRTAAGNPTYSGFEKSGFKYKGKK